MAWWDQLPEQIQNTNLNRNWDVIYGPANASGIRTKNTSINPGRVTSILGPNASSSLSWMSQYAVPGPSAPTYPTQLPQATVTPDQLLPPADPNAMVTSSSLSDWLPNIPGVNWDAWAPGGQPFIDWSQLGNTAENLTSNALLPYLSYTGQQQARDIVSGAADTASGIREQAWQQYLDSFNRTPQDYISQDPFLQQLQQQYAAGPAPFTPVEVPQGLIDVANSLTPENFNRILSQITEPGIARGQAQLARYGLENSTTAPEFLARYTNEAAGKLFNSLQTQVVGASEAIAQINQYNNLTETQRIELNNNLGSMLATTLQGLRGQDLVAATSVLNTALNDESSLYQSLAGMATPAMAAALAFLLGREMTAGNTPQTVINNNLNGQPTTPGTPGTPGGTSPSDLFTSVKNTLATIGAGAETVGSTIWGSVTDGAQWLTDNLGITGDVATSIAQATQGMSADGASLIIDMVNNGAAPDVAANLLNAGQYLQADGSIIQLFDSATGVGMPGTWLEGMNADQFLATGPPAPGNTLTTGGTGSITNWAAGNIGGIFGTWAASQFTKHVAIQEEGQLLQAGGAAAGGAVAAGAVAGAGFGPVGIAVGAALGAAAGWFAGTGLGRAIFGTGKSHGLSSGTSAFLARAGDAIPDFPQNDNAFRTFMSDTMGWSASDHTEIENKLVAEVATSLFASNADDPQAALRAVFTGKRDGPQALLIYLADHPDKFQELMQVQGSYEDYFKLNGGYDNNATHIFHEAVKATQAEGQLGGTDYDKQWAAATILRQMFNPEGGA